MLVPLCIPAIPARSLSQVPENRIRFPVVWVGYKRHGISKLSKTSYPAPHSSFTFNSQYDFIMYIVISQRTSQRGKVKSECRQTDSIIWYFSDRASWIDYILITNLMHWLLFIHKILFSSKCFEPQVLIFRGIQLYTCSIWYCHSSWWPVGTQYILWINNNQCIKLAINI